jgi:hypothetical protein
MIRPYGADAVSALRTATMNAFIFAMLFLPLASTPLDTSTAHGRADAIAPPTFSGVRPPARTKRYFSVAFLAIDQSNDLPLPP